MVSRRIQVFGKVQGVFFRTSTKEQADKLGLNGWVENRTDGSVHIEVTGESNAVNDLIQWCQKGPILASVDSVLVDDIP